MLLTFSLFLGVSNSALAGENGLVGYWKFDEGKGDIANDCSGNGNNGTVHGATYVDGKFGRALSFDGDDDYVDCGTDVSLNITDAITIGAWVKPKSLGNRMSIVNCYPHAYSFEIYDSNRLEYFHYFPGGTPPPGYFECFSNYSFQPDEWYHVALVRDPPYVSFYINGNFGSKYEYSTNPIDTNHIWIGCRRGGSQFFNGTIDEVRIYNQSLSTTEIKELYTQKPEVIVSAKDVVEPSRTYTPSSIIYTGTVFKDDNENGKFDVGEKGCSNIPISDGLNVVKSNQAGRYELPQEGDRRPRFIFISTPSGYRCTGEFFARVYTSSKTNFDFGLKEDTQSANSDFSFIQVGDSETSDPGKWLPEIKACIPFSKPAFIVHTGDICRKPGIEAHSRFMNKETMGVPVYYVIGNHDYIKGIKHGEKIFEDNLGPVYYSFNYGDRHFIVLAMARGVDGTPRPELLTEQLEWLKNDLAYVSAETEIVVFEHNPKFGKFIIDNGKGESFDLSKRKLVIFITGHWHAHQARHSKDGVLAITTAPPNKGGIDHSPRCFRIFTFSNGKLSINSRIGNQKHKLTIVSPIPGSEVSYYRGSKIPILANVYHTSCKVKEVKYSIHSSEGSTDWYPMEKKGEWSWIAKWRPKSKLSKTEEKKVMVKARFFDGKIIEKEMSFVLIPSRGKLPMPKDNWPMLLKNPFHQAIADSTVTPPLKLAWAAPAGKHIGFSSPVIMKGKVFIGTLDDDNATEQAIVAFDGKTGKELWRFTPDSSIKHTLAVDKNLVFATSVDGIVYALDANSGKLAWQQDLSLSQTQGVYGGSIIVKDILYAGAGHGLTALEPKTGKILWQNKKWRIHFSCSVTPALAGGILYAAQNWGNGLYAHNAKTGELLWNIGRKEEFDYLDKAPIIVENRLYITTGLRKSIAIIDTKTGKILSKKNVPDTRCGSTPLIAEGLIIFGTYSEGIVSLEAETLEIRWRFKTRPSLVATAPYSNDNSRTVHASPVLSGNIVYIGGTDGYFYALDIHSGKELWSINLGVPIYSSAAISGNAVYVSAYDGNLYAFTGN